MNKFILALLVVMMLITQAMGASDSEEQHDYRGGFNRGFGGGFGGGFRGGRSRGFRRWHEETEPSDQ